MSSVPHVLTLLEPCPHTGGPCEVAQALLETLVSAMGQAGDVVGADFSLSGVLETMACGRRCRLLWAGSGQVISVESAALASCRGPTLRAERLS